MRCNFALVGEIYQRLRTWRSIHRHLREETLSVLEIRESYEKRAVPGEHYLKYLVAMPIRRQRYHHPLRQDAFDFHVASPLALELANKSA
jgi:hypothetical protein